MCKICFQPTCIEAPKPGEPINIQSIADELESSGRKFGRGNNFRSLAATPG